MNLAEHILTFGSVSDFQDQLALDGQGWIDYIMNWPNLIVNNCNGYQIIEWLIQQDIPYPIRTGLWFLVTRIWLNGSDGFQAFPMKQRIAGAFFATLVNLNCPCAAEFEDELSYWSERFMVRRGFQVQLKWPRSPQYHPVAMRMVDNRFRQRAFTLLCCLYRQGGPGPWWNVQHVILFHAYEDYKQADN